MKVAIVLVALAAAQAANVAEAQLCGGTSLRYVVRGEDGMVLDQRELEVLFQYSAKPVGDDDIGMFPDTLSRTADGRYWGLAVEGTRTPVLLFRGTANDCTLHLAEVALFYRQQRMRLIFDVDLTGVTGGDIQAFPRRRTPPGFIVVESLPFSEGTFRLNLSRWLAQFQRYGEWGENAYPTIPAEFWEATRDTPPLEKEFPVRKTLGIAAPGKVAAVYWSVERDSCSIQVSFPSVPEGEAQPEHARVQVWLLESDGTAISSADWTPQSPPIAISNGGWTTPSVIYMFPAFARTEAVAVVVRIDDDYHIEGLIPEGSNEAP